MVDLSQARVVAVLARAPASGGKSRLFSALGIPPDPSLLSAMLLDTLDGIAAPGIRRVVAVEPAWACDEVRASLPPDVVVVPQVEGNLGQRMRSLMAALLADGAPAVALVGSDLPEIKPQAIVAAFTALTEDPGGLVLGPATDGGYYLIAATEVPDVFDEIEWGSSQVLAQTQTAAQRVGLRVRMLDSMADVDSPADLTAVSAVRTSEWVRRAGLTIREGRPSTF